MRAAGQGCSICKILAEATLRIIQRGYKLAEIDSSINYYDLVIRNRLLTSTRGLEINVRTWGPLGDFDITLFSDPSMFPLSSKEIETH